jgi:hypothetical protein
MQNVIVPDAADPEQSVSLPEHESPSNNLTTDCPRGSGQVTRQPGLLIVQTDDEHRSRGRGRFFK